MGLVSRKKRTAAWRDARRIGAVLLAALGATGCMTLRPTSTASELEDAIASGDVPTLAPANGLALARASRRPLALLLTSKSCGDCDATRAALWRALRGAATRPDALAFATLDVDQADASWKQLGSPPLPATILFAEGQERWRVFGADGVKELREVAREAPPSWVHGLGALPENAPPPRGARVFLVAASADSAAFAQEVVDQVAYWQSRGLKREEIACYVAIPSFGTYWRDRAQFQRLAAAMRRCYRADLALVAAHWRAAAAAKPASLYLYVTSHGVGEQRAVELARSYAAFAARRKGTSDGTYEEGSCKRVGHGQLTFDSIPGAVEGLSFDEVFSRTCRGLVSPTPMLTAPDLAALLRAVPEATPKIVVLQGCHSGAVVPSLLPPATTILAAASPDRSSFGCNADGDRTVYGDKLLQVLRTRRPALERPAEWVAVHDDVFKLVGEEETRLEIGETSRSLPQIFAGATP
jgi:hypothetical protein